MSIIKNFFFGDKDKQASGNSRFNTMASVLDDLKPKFTQANQNHKFQSYEREITRFYTGDRQLITMSHNTFGSVKRDNYYFGRGNHQDYKSFIEIILQEPNNLEGKYLGLLKDLITFHASSSEHFNLGHFDYLKKCPKEIIKELLPSLGYGLKYAGRIGNSLQIVVALFASILRRVFI